jgi:hypothetical protein
MQRAAMVRYLIFATVNISKNTISLVVFFFQPSRLNPALVLGVCLEKLLAVSTYNTKHILGAAFETQAGQNLACMLGCDN